MCDKGFIWSPCKCECDKSCDIGEYLDYENYKCRKNLVDKLVDECNETIAEEVEIINHNKNKYTSCIVYIVLFSIFFTINVEIGVYFAYCKYMNHNKKIVPKYYDYVYHA